MSKDYLRRNQESWDAHSKDYQSTHQSQLPIDDPTWGVWGIAEAQLQIFGATLDEVRGKDVLEFGCGGAQWSVALARRGARVTGVDLSAQQLEFAAKLVAQSGAEVRLLHANAE